MKNNVPWSLIVDWFRTPVAMTFLPVIFALIHSHPSNEIRVKSNAQLYANILHLGYFLVCYRHENGFACQKKRFLPQLSSTSSFWLGFWFLSLMCFPSFICVFVNYALTLNVVDTFNASNHAFKSALADLARSKKIAAYQQNMFNTRVWGVWTESIEIERRFIDLLFSKQWSVLSASIVGESHVGLFSAWWGPVTKERLA